MNSTIRLSRLAWSCLALGSTALAQIPLHDNSAFMYERMRRNDFLMWPSPPSHPAPSFKRLVAGDFIADGELDVAVHEGDRAYVWHDVSYSNLLLPIAVSDVNDIDVAPTGVGQPDHVALVRSTGLFSASWPAQLSQSPSISAVPMSNPVLWMGAKLVRCADFDADGVTDYVGLASDGVTILRLSGGVGQTTEKFAAPHPVRDLGLVLWDLDAPRELAIATTHGMYVHELVGATSWNPSATFDSGSDCTSLAILRGVGRDRLGWVVDLGANDEVHIARMGLAVEIVQAPAGAEVVGLCFADADGDSDRDLMFNTRSHLAPFFVRNYAPQIPAFATAIDWNLAIVDDDPLLLGAAASNNNCAPLFRDFNGDGRADLFLALEQTSSTLDHAPAAVYMPWIDPNLPLGQYWLAGGIYSTPDSSTNVRSLDLMISSTVLPSHQGVPANALEVIVYRQESRTGPLEQEAIAFLRYDVRNFPPEVGSYMRLSIGIQDDACLQSIVPGETNLYWFELWPRTLDWATGPQSNPPVIRNFARRFVGIGANEADVCGYLCDEGGAAVMMNETPLNSGLVPDSCITNPPTPPTSEWPCVLPETEGTTQGPAAVIRVRLPLRHQATQLPTTPLFVVCPPYVI